MIAKNKGFPTRPRKNNTPNHIWTVHVGHKTRKIKSPLHNRENTFCYDCSIAYRETTNIKEPIQKKLTDY